MSIPRFYEIDTDPHDVYRVYSDGNFGEVAPERLSIMSWSLIGPPMEKATRTLATKLLGSKPWFTGSAFVFLGYFGCRPYHNLAAYCQLALEVPGVEPEDVTASYFEGIAPVEGLRRLGTGALAKALVGPRLARCVLAVPSRLMELDGDVHELELLAEASLGDETHTQLGHALARGRQVLDDAWDLHITTTSTLVPLRGLQSAVGRRLVPRFDDVKPWLGSPDELVWSRLYDLSDAGDVLTWHEFLTRPFYEIADDRGPWDGYGMRHASTASARSASSAVVDPETAFYGMVSGGRRAALEVLARRVRDGMAHREASKSLVMRVMHVMRKLVPAMATLFGLGDDWPYLTVGELATTPVSSQPGQMALTAKSRQASVEQALLTPMAGYLDFSSGGGRGAVPSRAAAQSSGGRGVSPGTATGVVVHPSVDDLPDADTLILVCESADAEVQPLLPFVAGIVTARGSELSHIAILARELGIPAIVGFKDALRLEAGSTVSIDGTTGEVRVAHE